MDVPCSILIVEDESIVVLDLEANLSRLGYLVVGSAHSAKQAIQQAEVLRPDLVLMDIQLHGEMDGLRAADIIYEHWGIPVVFMTANVGEEVISRSRQKGSYGFLNKPFRPSELDATLKIALHQHQASRALSAQRDQLETQIQITSEALGATREELQALSRHLMQAQEVERARIARELHDDLGQQVALLGMQVDLLEGSLPAELRERVANLASGLRVLAQGLRDVSHRLHPSILEDLGLTEALRFLVSSFSAQGLRVEESLDESGDLPLDVSTSFYRIAQESLANVLKHAPQANVRLTLTVSRLAVDMRIADDGLGFSLGDVRQRGGLGLISMQERARLAGGNLLLSAEPGKGTTVLVRVLLRS